jgi:hypothetical protein
VVLVVATLSSDRAAELVRRVRANVRLGVVPIVAMGSSSSKISTPFPVASTLQNRYERRAIEPRPHGDANRADVENRVRCTRRRWRLIVR